MIINQKKLVVLGASFNTGNLGVSALAWSSLKLLRKKWPNAEIALLGVGRKPGSATIYIDGTQETFATWPVRYTPNIFAQHHILRLCLGALLFRLFPFVKNFSSFNTSTLGSLLHSDFSFDITGGDSFSDIYGAKRLTFGFLLKFSFLLKGTPLILLPQTYGPFKSKISKLMAKYVLKKANKIYSRDQEGITVVNKIIGHEQKVSLSPDVAFTLDSIRPDNAQINQIESLKYSEKIIIGFNISGLLYNGGYSKDNMFGLSLDYRNLINEIIIYFTSLHNVHILLVPHVLPSPDFSIEDDYLAADNLVHQLSAEQQDKIMLLNRDYNQNTIKYCIGQTDFFIGSRMHATIAALSQYIPAVGLAYSKKFKGVFATAGVENCVLDLRKLNLEETLTGIKTIFETRNNIRQTLESTVPSLQQNLLTLFDTLDD